MSPRPNPFASPLTARTVGEVRQHCKLILGEYGAIQAEIRRYRASPEDAQPVWVPVNEIVLASDDELTTMLGYEPGVLEVLPIFSDGISM